MLKNRSNFPPGGYQFFQPETGWRMPDGKTFEQAVTMIMEHRLVNPRFGLSTNRQTIADQLDAYTCHRIKNDENWCTGAEKKTSNPASISFIPRLLRWRASVAGLVESLSSVPRGTRSLIDWIGDGHIPVSRELSQKRADICNACPENQPANLTEKASEQVAAAIKEFTGVKNHLKLTVAGEEHLQVCKACACPLPLKVHVPIKHIWKFIKPAVINKLPQHCWQLNERRRLLVVLPFSTGDYFAAEKLLLWIEELGGCPAHPALLVADCKLEASKIEHLEGIAKRCFATVEVIATTNSLPDETWPIGANWMFRTAIDHVADNYICPFLWLEPDCIPIQRKWLNAIESEYYAANKPFMGHIMDVSDPAMPKRYMSGNAVYPHDAKKYFNGSIDITPEASHKASKVSKAFDATSPARVVPNAHPTTLILNVWKAGDDGDVSLTEIPQGTMLYHRSKNGALIDTLRKARFDTVNA